MSKPSWRTISFLLQREITRIWSSQTSLKRFKVGFGITAFKTGLDSWFRHWKYTARSRSSAFGAIFAAFVPQSEENQKYTMEIIRQDLGEIWTRKNSLADSAILTGFKVYDQVP